MTNVPEEALSFYDAMQGQVIYKSVSYVRSIVQVMQDVRHAVLGGPSGPNDVTAATVYGGSAGRLIPIVIAMLVFLGALAFFRREGRYFAERV